MTRITACKGVVSRRTIWVVTRILPTLESFSKIFLIILLQSSIARSTVQDVEDAHHLVEATGPDVGGDSGKNESPVACFQGDQNAISEQPLQGFDINKAQRTHWARLAREICPVRTYRSCHGISRTHWTAANLTEVHAPQSLLTGTWSTVLLSTFTSNGTPKVSGGDAWTATLHDPTTCVRIPTVIFDNGNGTYTVAFLAHLPGTYDLIARLAYSACNGVMDPPQGDLKDALQESDSCYIGAKIVRSRAVVVGPSHSSSLCGLRQSALASSHEASSLDREDSTGALYQQSSADSRENNPGLGHVKSRVREGEEGMQRLMEGEGQGEGEEGMQHPIKGEGQGRKLREGFGRVGPLGVVVRGEEAAVRQAQTIRFLPCCTAEIKVELAKERVSDGRDSRRDSPKSRRHMQGFDSEAQVTSDGRDSRTDRPQSRRHMHGDEGDGQGTEHDLRGDWRDRDGDGRDSGRDGLNSHDSGVGRRQSGRHMRDSDSDGRDMVRHSGRDRQALAPASRLLLWGDSTMKRQWLLLMMLARQHCQIRWQPRLFEELYLPSECTPPPNGTRADAKLELALEQCTGGVPWTEVPVATNTIEVSRYFPDSTLVDMHNATFWDEVLGMSSSSAAGYHARQMRELDAHVQDGDQGVDKIAPGYQGRAAPKLHAQMHDWVEGVGKSVGDRGDGMIGGEVGSDGLKFVVYMDGMGCRDIGSIRRDLEQTTRAGDLLIINVGLHCLLGHTFDQWHAYVGALAAFLRTLPARVVWRSSFTLREHVWRGKQAWAASMQAETEARRAMFDSAAEDVMLANGITVWAVNGLLDLGEYRPHDMRHADAYTTRALNLQMAELLLG